MSPLLHFVKTYFPMETYQELNMPFDFDQNMSLSKKDLNKWRDLPKEYLSDNDHFQMSLHYFKEANISDEIEYTNHCLTKSLQHNQNIELNRSDLAQFLLGHLYLKLAFISCKKKQRKLIQLAKSCYLDITSPELCSLSTLHITLCHWVLEETEESIRALQKKCRQENFPITGNLILSKMFQYQGLKSIAHFYHERYQRSQVATSLP